MATPKTTLHNIDLIPGVENILHHGNIDPVTLHVSSRPKKGNQSQDRAAVSLWEKPLSAEHLRAAYLTAAESTAKLEGGCSATTLLITSNEVHVAWVGDSPAFLVGINPKTGTIDEIRGLNEPHIPTYDQEAILAKGGIVNGDGRIDLSSSEPDQTNRYSLSMSRAFGNEWLGSVLIREPGIATFSRNGLSDNLLWYAVVGSDGILTESERNLMFPANLEATFAENSLINYCATLFQKLVNTEGKPWLPESGNWAADITQIAQNRLLEMENKANRELVGFAAVDDTTMLILSLGENQAATIAITVADGHRSFGEITAQKAVDAIHTSLDSQVDAS